MRCRERDVGEILGGWVRYYRAVSERENLVHLRARGDDHVKRAGSNADAWSDANVAKGAAQDISGGVDGAGNTGICFTRGDKSMGELESRSLLYHNRLETGAGHGLL